MNSEHTTSFKIGVWKVQDFGNFDLSPMSLAMIDFQGLSLALVLLTSQIKDQDMSEPMIRSFVIAPLLKKLQHTNSGITF